MNTASRLEQLIVGALLASTALVPPLFVEAFPYSTAPMFAAAFDEIWSYSLKDADGKVLSNDVYGLRTNPNWYLEDFYAVKFPATVVAPPTRAADMETVVAHIRETGRARNEKFPLQLRAICCGNVDGSRVGVCRRGEWTIEDSP